MFACPSAMATAGFGSMAMMRPGVFMGARRVSADASSAPAEKFCREHEIMASAVLVALMTLLEGIAALAAARSTRYD